MFRGLSLSVAALLALGPIQWITIANVGLNLKLMHIPLIILCGQGFGLLLSSQLQENRALRALRPFGVSYAIFMALLLFSVVWAVKPGAGMAFVIKFTLYFILSLGTIIYCSNMSQERLFRSLVVGSLGATFGFILIAWVTLAQRGISLPDTVITAIRTGNPTQLQFGIFLNLFNNSLDTDNLVSSSVRHTSIGFIFIATIIQLASLFQRKSVIVLAAFVLSVLIVLISVSRSQIVILFFAMMIVFWSMRSRVAPSVYFGALVAIVVGLFIVLNSDLSGLMGIVDQRFGSFQDDERNKNFSEALTLINDRMFWGYGAMHVFGDKEFAAHNLFLAAWVQAGVFAFVAAMVFYGTLLAYFVQKVLTHSHDPFRMCLIVLLTLPLIRSLLSAGGMFSLPEWFAITLFFAFAFREDKAPAKFSLPEPSARQFS